MDHNELHGRPEKDHTAVRFPPPLIYAASILLGVALEFSNWTIGIDLSLIFRISMSTPFAAAGLGLVLASIGLFNRTGQKPEPWTTTPEIITDGIYRYTRNPMYVGMGLVQVGIGIGALNVWIVVLVLPAMFLVYVIAVRHEEAYLESKFGKAYLDYKQRVRRWL